MKNFIQKFSIAMLLTLVMLNVGGSIVLAATNTTDPSQPNGLVTCGKTGTPQEQAQGCNFAEAVKMINTLITYIIYLSISLAAISFAYAGWLYMTAGDNSGKVTKARTIFLDVGIGFILVLSAWLIFKLIETTFLDTGAGYYTFLG